MAIEKLGRYRITSELGQGAMGVVYKAEDPVIERPVAIKTIKLDLSKAELANFEARFYREAKSAGRLNHPNIVTIYDVGKSDNMAYMAMEFLEGQALRDILDAHTALAIDKIADIAAQVADGLAYAHENGIVHRDIKPANIMIVRDGVAKITDFGIAQMPTGSRTLAGTVLGSPKYMAPEQVVGQQVDGRSDIFSLGVVMYEMLTGESPFDGDNISAIMYRIINETPPSPKTLNPRVPDGFDYIVAKALAKHPDDRYQDAAELAHDLRNCQNLSVPQPVGAADGPVRTLERRARPRLDMGEETLFLNQITGGMIGSRDGEKSAETDQGIAAIVRWPAGLEGIRKLLLWLTPVLLVAFAATVIWGTREHTEATPQPQTLAVAPQQPAVGAPVPPVAETPISPPAPSAEAVPQEQERKVEVEADALPPRPMSARRQEVQKSKGDALAKAGDQQQQAAPAAGQALITFAITPWGEIYIDGNKVGASPPLKELHVPAGKHRIEIRNLNFTAYSETVDLRPDTTKKIKYLFK